MIARSLPDSGRRGFTLVELLITISIIAIMASMILFAMFAAQDAAREQKTKALIAKLNNIVMQRYESYRTRRIPFVFPAVVQSAFPPDRALAAKELARARLDCLRDLMRMELPERWNDILDPPVTPYAHGLANTVLPPYVGTLVRPSVNASYKAKYDAAVTAGKTPTDENQFAECLYLIVMDAIAQEGDSRDVFKAGDIGDTDGDGASEFLDGWRRPIRFLRWCGGFTSPVNQLAAGRVSSSTVTSQTGTVVLNASPTFGPTGTQYQRGVMAVLTNGIIDASRMSKITGYAYSGGIATFSFETLSPLPPPFPGGKPNANEVVVIMAADPFDSRDSYPSTIAPPYTQCPTFAMSPVIFSAGSDGQFGVICDVGGGLRYIQDHLMPIVYDNSNQMMGTEKAVGTEPANCHLDNITSHDLSKR